MPPALPPAGGKHGPVTLIQRASRFLQGPPPDDADRALIEAAVIQQAHRPGFLTTRCRACGQTWQCTARVEGDRRAALALARKAEGEARAA